MITLKTTKVAILLLFSILLQANALGHYSSPGNTVCGFLTVAYVVSDRVLLYCSIIMLLYFLPYLDVMLQDNVSVMY